MTDDESDEDVIRLDLTEQEGDWLREDKTQYGDLPETEEELDELTADMDEWIAEQRGQDGE